MRLFFVLVFLVFSSLLFQVQAQVLIPGPILEYNFDQFDWQAFSDQENVQKYIDFRNETFSEVGADFVVYDINLDKRDLIRLEQELALYKWGIKRGLSEEDIQKAEEAIRLHRENVTRIESQMRFWAGLGGLDDEDLSVKARLKEAGIAEAGDYYDEVWELYKGDHDVLFNMVEKTDRNLYNLLGQDDEAYAQMILPQVKQYIEKMGGVTQSYHGAFQFMFQGGPAFNQEDITRLLDIYPYSVQIYHCFKKNFKNPDGGPHQQALMGVIESWYESQSRLGANSLIELYKQGVRTNPWNVVGDLKDYRAAPRSVREEVAEFYRGEILYNPDFINTEDDYKLGARVDALVGLKYFNMLNEEERELFDRAIEAGVIEPVGKKGKGFFGYSDPLP